MSDWTKPFEEKMRRARESEDEDKRLPAPPHSSGHTEARADFQTLLDEAEAAGDLEERRYKIGDTECLLSNRFDDETVYVEDWPTEIED